MLTRKKQQSCVQRNKRQGLSTCIALLCLHKATLLLNKTLNHVCPTVILQSLRPYYGKTVVHLSFLCVLKYSLKGSVSIIDLAFNSNHNLQPLLTVFKVWAFIQDIFSSCLAVAPQSQVSVGLGRILLNCL